MINPDLIIPLPRLHSLRLRHLNLILIQQRNHNMLQQHITHIPPQTLPGSKPKAPVRIPCLGHPLTQKALWVVLMAVLAPVRVSDVERIGIDDEVGASGEMVAADDAGCRDSLGNREWGYGAETRGFVDAGCEQSILVQEIGIEFYAHFIALLAGLLYLFADSALVLGVCGHEDNVPGYGADGDVEVGHEHFVDGVEVFEHGDFAGLEGAEDFADGGLAAGFHGAFVGQFVEGDPAAFEFVEFAVCLGGEVAGPVEAGEAAGHDEAHEAFAEGSQSPEFLLDVGGEFSVNDFCDNEEGEELHVFGWVEETAGEIAFLAELVEPEGCAALDDGDVAAGHGFVEGGVHDAADALPVVLVLETDAVAEDLAHYVAGVHVFAFDVAVRVFEDGADVVGVGDDAGKVG